MAENISEPLTVGHFEAWRLGEFAEHTKREENYEQKVDKLDAQLSMWLKIVSIGVGIISVVGGTTLALFFWVLNEKNAAILENQKAIHEIALTQREMVATLKHNQAELARQAQADARMIELVSEYIRSQARKR